MLPHCDKDDVMHAETAGEPLRLAVTEGEREGIREGEGMPLGLSLSEAERDTVAHALCEVLPPCEREGVKLEVQVAHALCVAHPLCEGEGVKLTDAHEEEL